MKKNKLQLPLLFSMLAGIPASAQVVNINNGIKLVAKGTISLVVDKGGLKNDGIFIPDSSTVFFDGASTTAISGSLPITFFNTTFRGTGTKSNEGDASVINTLAIEGSTILDADGVTDGTAFTLKSSDTATANVDKLVNGDIIGNVTVERFINTGTEANAHAKSWQFLATPTTGQSYYQSWQEGGTVPPGYGTWITGTGTGFDVTTPLPSVKFYDHLSSNWTAVTNTNNPLQNKLGYMLFVRGDRTVTTSSGSPNNTNMRSKGVLFTAINPPPSVPVAANLFQSFGNPYASRIEFEKLYNISTGINNVFYVWDPKLNGNWNYGGYQTLSAVTGYIPAAGSATTNYPAGVPCPFIESGQAVLVEGDVNGGNVNFDEDCKVAGNRLVTRQAVTNNSNLPFNRQFLFSTLFTSAGTIADGNIVAFENGLGNDLDAYDAKKILNSGENFGISRNQKVLAIEARNGINAADTIFYYIQNLKQQPYQFRFAPVHIQGGVSAFLIDRFQNNSTPVSLTDSTFIDFAVTATQGSGATDRFLLVFQQAAVVPVKIMGIAATRNSDRSHQVTWKVDNEINIQKYIIERSADSRDFANLGDALPITNNGGAATYSYRDGAPLNTTNFYKVKAISNDGQVQYSDIVKLEPENAISSIVIYPNPVKNNMIHIVFKNQEAGKYEAVLSNKLGQIIYRNSFQIVQGNAEQTIRPVSIMSAGTYQLSIIKEDGARIVQQVIVD